MIAKNITSERDVDGAVEDARRAAAKIEIELEAELAQNAFDDLQQRWKAGEFDHLYGKWKARGVLVSGGLDSSILVGHLLREGRRVQPFYIRTGLYWQTAELPALERYLAAIASESLAPLEWPSLMSVEPSGAAFSSRTASRRRACG